jgi:glycine oxidase
MGGTPTGARAPDLLVAGAGAIGLAVAWRAAERGMDVVVVERDGAGEATSRVAAGMLAPVAEVEFGGAGRRLLDLAMRSARLWPAFAEQLARLSGVEIVMRPTGTLLLARDSDEEAELERQLEFRRSLGLDVRRLRPSAARELEPALAPTLRAALEAPGDHSVDPRGVLSALLGACLEAGVHVRENTSFEGVEHDGRAVRSAVLAGGERIAAGAVVLATGPWSGVLAGLPENAALPVRPVKGQILRLRDPAGPGLLERVIRYEGGYVVPRGDGRYVLGGTVEERGFDLSPTAGATYELLREARELLPGVTELEIEELSVGMRPGTPDNLPAIGRATIDGLWWASGHYRNGILLTPLTAELLAGALCGEDGGEAMEWCDPARFAVAEPASAAGEGGTGREEALR